MIQLLRGETTDLWIITVSTTILFVLVVIRDGRAWCAS